LLSHTVPLFDYITSWILLFAFSIVFLPAVLDPFKNLGPVFWLKTSIETTGLKRSVFHSAEEVSHVLIFMV